MRCPPPLTLMCGMSSLSKHPVPMETSPELMKAAGTAQHGHRLHHPSLL